MHKDTKHELTKCRKTQDTQHNRTPQDQSHNTSFKHQFIFSHVLLVHPFAIPVHHYGIENQ